MKIRKPDEMEQKHYLMSAKNAFIFYVIALLIWSAYDLVTTGDTGWQMTILLVGAAIFWWSKVIFYRDTETEGKAKLPSKAILWTVFYLAIFLVFILIIQ